VPAEGSTAIELWTLIFIPPTAAAVQAELDAGIAAALLVLLLLPLLLEEPVEPVEPVEFDEPEELVEPVDPVDPLELPELCDGVPEVLDELETLLVAGADKFAPKEVSTIAAIE
jgi:hypothetical protein